mmetsp:Transcript_2394/g.3632  ORF Transcript_2394/g.3632 Transcript_2394/m.3632 type:complete len:320 (+) Transcript_2394:86-1045(+)|eukprot:CAMPEP_0195298496 /NCGR_PEP_ID=MMETSP0707-20130614/23611_1 /TAXON_ID=33640 /ORGANISM="Asterionellopsis glacialis, Strain CCMP134" /LENGTH=319 /DNA_ID=CAMNT_0040360635 /DNA_START=73 /DNA_END=1032 /DNA_ORIENTATION=-
MVLFLRFLPLIAAAHGFLPNLKATTTKRSLPTFLGMPSELKNELQMSAVSSSLGNMPRIGASDLEQLAKKGFVVIDNFLPEDLQNDLRQDVSYLRSKSKFNVAKIGQDSTNNLNQDIRVAETCFIGNDKLQDCPNAARDSLYGVLDQVRADLSQNPILDSPNAVTRGTPALDSNLSELLFAFYPTGGFYRRHRDAIPGSASVLRSYSLLLYLNEGWTPEQAGQLRMHMDSGGDFLPEGEDPNFIDVEPRGGTLVLFKSDMVPHEVLDTNAERLAVVGWYNRGVTASDIANLSEDGGKTQVLLLAVAAALVTVGVVSLLT